MKILMIGSFPPPIHGMSLANKVLLGNLKKEHSVFFLNTNTQKDLGNLNQQGKMSLKKVFTSAFQIFKGIFKILFSKRFDIVYITPAQSVNGYIKYIPFMWVAKLKKIPYVIHIHGGYFRTMYDQTNGWRRRLVDNSLNNLSGAIALGNSLKYMFKGLIPEKKIFVCENGIEDETFATKAEIDRKIEKFKEDNTIRIVYLSNLMREKGILDLMKAVNTLKDKGKNVHLDVAGAIEPEIKTDVERYFKEFPNEITYHGIISGSPKKSLLLDNYIFCLPTYYHNEGQPISILEAMACGCAIVTTDHGGIKDIAKKEFSVFVEKQNSDSIAQGIVDAYNNFEIFSFEAWKAAKDSYTSDQFVNRVTEVLFECSKSTVEK
ncbi:MAG: glycosyltransferase family 4 protein [Thermotogae bacterium]|nr:glycosyltransferase family 4 protein [Thermotogota bacterium]